MATIKKKRRIVRRKPKRGRRPNAKHLRTTAVSVRLPQYAIDVLDDLPESHSELLKAAIFEHYEIDEQEWQSP